VFVTESSVWSAVRARSAAGALPGASSADDGAQDQDSAAAAPIGVPDPAGWTDPLTSTDGPRFWDRIIASEGARRQRYGRAVTVAMVEFTGFASDGSWLSHELELQVFGRVAHVLVKQVRTSDYIARIRSTRFGIVLLETDEIAAINFVDRVRAACRKELGTGSGIEVRTGWASPAEDESLDAAVYRAGARLTDPAFQGAP
jgi:diguanylate cyclase (GGDEF)-like protein